MSECCDVVVIGAGVGGLAAASTLARSGCAVRVLERRPHIGGTAFVYQRRGFVLPMGPLGFSRPDLVDEALPRLGLEPPLARRRVSYRVRTEGLDVPVSLPLADTARALARAFPDDAPGVSAFFSEAAAIGSALRAGNDPPPEGRRPAAERLSRTVTDPRLRRLLGSIGTRPPYSSMTLIAAMWRLMGDEGIWYPRDGLRGFCESLARAATGAGAALELRRGVAGVELEDGEVTGVRLDDGTRIGARAVVSNADYPATFLGLVGREALSERFARSLSASRLSGSVLQVALGIERSGVDLDAFSDATRIITGRERRSDDAGPDWSAPAVDADALAGDEIEISLWSGDDPALAPAGGAVIVIRVAADHAHFARWRPAPGRRVASYENYKRALAAALIGEAGRVAPGLADAIRVVDVATPLTFEELGGRSAGAVAGWSWRWDDGREAGAHELVRTPVRGLYMAGHQAVSALVLGGVPSAALTGVKAADAVLEQEPPGPDPPLPGRGS